MIECCEMRVLTFNFQLSTFNVYRSSLNLQLKLTIFLTFFFFFCIFTS